MAVNYNCWCVKSTLIVSLVIALCLSIGKTKSVLYMAVNYNCWCVKSTLIVSLVIALCLSIGKTKSVFIYGGEL